MIEIVVDKGNFHTSIGADSGIDSKELIYEAVIVVRGLYDSIKRESAVSAAIFKHMVMQEWFWSDENKGVIQDA